MKSGLAVFTLLLLASIAGAQPHPPMRSRPHRPLAAPPPKMATPPIRSTPSTPQAESPFAAGPRTYAPRYDVPQVNQRRRGEAVPFSAGAIGIAEFATPSDAASTADDSAKPLPTRGRSTIAPPPLDPSRIVASRGSDTYYVIPGCYAGNRPPDPQRLPKGCDAVKLRATPVR